MKWFKHESDAHMNLKLQAVIERYGLEAYGYYWALVELVAKEGKNYMISSDKEWHIYFSKFLNIETSKQKKYLAYLAEKSLINKDELLKGNLYIPKLEERCDEYTEKVRRRSGHGTDNVGLEENRTEENRTDNKRTYGELKKVRLTDEEFKKLNEKLGEKNTSFLIGELDEYVASKGKRYPSHYATILNWARRKIQEHNKPKGKAIV